MSLTHKQREMLNKKLKEDNDRIFYLDLELRCLRDSVQEEVGTLKRIMRPLNFSTHDLPLLNEAVAALSAALRSK